MATKIQSLARALAGLSLALVLAIAGAIQPAAADVINQTTWSGTAIEGYDPVAYFAEGRPVEGSSEFEHEWMDATWRFASAENRDLFAADPDKYAPQYGGYCAYAVANGYTASIDPEAWRVVDGKLYLNFDQQVQQLWLQDIEGYIANGDANWPGIREQLAS